MNNKILFITLERTTLKPHARLRLIAVKTPPFNPKDSKDVVLVYHGMGHSLTIFFFY